jgi:glyoxylase-like metal-dependent hydrolase (beta-lactamase superfamily II)
MAITARPQVTAFFDPATHTISYVVKDPLSPACAIIDSVMDFDYASGRISYHSADAIVGFVRSHDLEVEWIIDTHVHADHLSAAQYLKGQLGGVVAIGDQISLIQKTFAGVFGESADFPTDGSQFDHLFGPDEAYKIGSMNAVALSTPGHTPACSSHLIGDAAFVGDTLFMPDSGTARADFPGGDARTLYRSIMRILSLPADTRLFMCHDYGAGERPINWESSVAQERASNIHVGHGIDEDQFVELRQARDATLKMPALIIPSIQVNMRAGLVPTDPVNGRPFLKLPINAL